MVFPDTKTDILDIVAIWFPPPYCNGIQGLRPLLGFGFSPRPREKFWDQVAHQGAATVEPEVVAWALGQVASTRAVVEVGVLMRGYD